MISSPSLTVLFSYRWRQMCCSRTDVLFSYQDTRKWEKKRLIEIRSPCLSRGDGGGGGCDHFSRSGRTQRSRAE